MLRIFSNFRNPDNDPYFEHIRSKWGDKPMTIFYEFFPSSNELEINPVNFLMIQEPNEFFGFHDRAIHFSHIFTGIFTWSDKVMNACPNAVPFVHNGRTLDKAFCDSLLTKEKKFEISFLCGTKALTDGHRLRHDIYPLGSQIQIPKKWFDVLEDYDTVNDARPGYTSYSKDLSHIPPGVDPIGYGRRILFEESMFNIVIENVNHNNFYNKIGDNFLTKTVPIYWGCENISNHGYDERGILRFKNYDDLVRNVLPQVTPEKYEQMKPYLEYNYQVALQDDLNDKTDQFFEPFFKLNNL